TQTSSHYGGSYSDSYPCRDSEGKPDTCSCSGSCYYTTIDEVRDVAYLEQYIEEEFAKAEQRLKSAQEAYDGIVEAYNQCSEWDTEIKYEPDIKYDYAEDYLNDHRFDYGDM